MSSEPRRHQIQSGETLADIARHWGIPGWQALYFCDINQSFRRRCPDPWCLTAGEVLWIPALPGHAEVLRAALGARLRLLDQVRREARHLLERQCAGLDDPGMTESSRLIGFLVETTLAAIQLLKAEDTGMSGANWALARDAAARHPPRDAATGATLLELLARAAAGVVWGIPASSARPWCDARDPGFWGQTLWPVLCPASGVSRTLLAANCRRAGEAVARALDELHREAVAEQGILERVAATVVTEGVPHD